MQKKTRVTERHVAAFQVELRYKTGGCVPALIRNISPEGVHMEIETVPEGIGSELDLAFTLEGENWRVPAVVIHSNPTGMGVMFRSPKHRLFRIVTAPLQRPISPVAGRVMLG
ncbi:MAG: hypothetical protein JMN25_12810 [gamma proteobacterium endosymbiont of Lamellibrachia anaximandri]|nr:hypothetical protein [gamma proteobacterium endosymbiont of Lamellibrachia anaximandri]